MTQLLHLAVKRKITRHTKRPKNTAGKDRASIRSRQGRKVAGIIRVGFKTTVIPMLRAQTDRTHSMKSGRGDVNREMEILREKMTEIKNTRGKEECFPWADEKTGRG